ncbi:MAG: hypothetical protein KIT69_19100, partial [Propionibacteriaceae bacterium]|nr:hypothetical protein [Propionibacteriaceae bacterium]
WEPASANVREEVPAPSGAPYLRVAVDSPCFDTTLTLDAPEFGANAAASAAYYHDTRTVKTYW